MLLSTSYFSQPLFVLGTWPSSSPYLFTRSSLTSPFPVSVHPNTAIVQMLLVFERPLSLPAQLLKTRVFFLNWFPSPFLSSHLPLHSNLSLWWTAFRLQVHIPSPAPTIPVSPRLHTPATLDSFLLPENIRLPFLLAFIIRLWFPCLSAFTNIMEVVFFGSHPTESIGPSGTSSPNSVVTLISLLLFTCLSPCIGHKLF